MSRSRVVSVVLLAVALAGRAGAQGAPQTKPLDPANIDSTCAPCKDFYQFANGGWLARTTIPADRPGWGSFNELQERNYTALRAILEDAAAAAGRPGADADTRLLGTFYASCMDTVAIERAGAAPLAPELREIARVKDRRQLAAAIGRLHRLGVGAGFGFGSGQDAKRSSRVIAIAAQGGLGLPDRDYYTRTDSGSAGIRRQYREHVARMLTLAGDDSAAAASSAEAILALETALAHASMTRVQRRDPDSTYHLMALAELRRLAPSFAWERYFEALGIPAPAEVNVRQPRFLAALDSLAAAAPLETWRAYLRWQLVSAAAPSLASAFERESFRFNSTVLSGVAEMQPRWKRCLRATDGAIGEALGRAYVRTAFTPEAKARALEMVRNIQAVFRERLARLEWMSEATKRRAFAKLDAIVNKIGYPDRWRDYGGLALRPGAYAGNVMAAQRFEVRRRLAKIGRPVDRGEWAMTPPTVNAYYSGTLNEIVFPAGIMQPPFFDPAADDAVNYGGMGAVIGHEITHGFDDQGRKYDAEGNLSGWWAPEDETAFATRAEAVVEQFAGYVAVDTLRLNGRLTLGENIADLGGLTIAYHAYRRAVEAKGEPAPIDGFTGDQRFFLAWAQIWRQLRRPEYERLLVTTDTHSPGRWRTNGPLGNMPEFARAFGCVEGDPMVRPASVRASIW